jgi:very-short-patch-repair endonuclease
MLKCQLCNYETDKQQKLSKHTSFYHKLKFPEYLIQIKYNGVNPLCECGCREKTRYSPKDGDFFKFIVGHHSRKEGHWGDWNDSKRVEKIISTRKQKFASGEYDYIKEAVKENRKQPGLGKNISKGAKGIPKPKPEGFGVGRIQSEETKQKMSDSAMKRIIKEDKIHTSKLETIFQNILFEQNIENIHSYYAKEIKAFYDFYLPKYNILIEVDGDFYHCNPIKYPDGSICKTQTKNIKRDKQKNQWAQDNGFKLLRFWEKDINENPQQIIETLQKELT